MHDTRVNGSVQDGSLAGRNEKGSLTGNGLIGWPPVLGTGHRAGSSPASPTRDHAPRRGCVVLYEDDGTQASACLPCLVFIPFVYRIGHGPFKAGRGVRLPYGVPDFGSRCDDRKPAGIRQQARGENLVSTSPVASASVCFCGVIG